MQKAFYTYNGATIKSFLNDTNCGHWFPPTAPQTELQWLYMNIEGSGITAENRIKNPAIGRYLEEGVSQISADGVLDMWDQWPLISDVVDQLYPDASDEEKTKYNSKDFHDMLRWGLVYYPNSCLTKSCKMQLVVHGCTMQAYDMAKEWAPVGSANEIIMVFP